MAQIPIGQYASAVQAIVNANRQTTALDLSQIQAVIDAYENVKNSVSLPSYDLPPAIPPTGNTYPPYPSTTPTYPPLPPTQPGAPT